MKTIYKYPLKLKDKQDLELPIRAKILCIQTQNNIPCLWAQVDPGEKDSETRIIKMYGTGHPVVEAENDTISYLGTFQIDGGTFVYHAFEKVR